MKVLGIFVLLSLAFIGCNQREQGPDPTKVAHQIGKKYADTYKNDGLILEVFGRGCEGGLDEITLSYKSKQHVHLEKSRRILIENSRRLIDLINGDEKITSSLGYYPYTLKNLDLRIHFIDENGDEYTDGAICGVHYFYSPSSNKTCVMYRIYNPSEGRREVILEETYEEAERIVNGGG
jgi:hypothetical protein